MCYASRADCVEVDGIISAQKCGCTQGQQTRAASVDTIVLEREGDEILHWEMLEVLAALLVSPVTGTQLCAGQEPPANRGCNLLIYFHNSFHL